MPHPLPEIALHHAVVDYLARCVPAPPDGPWWKTINPVPANPQTVGALNIVLCWRGRFVGIELEASRSKPGATRDA